MGKPPGPTWGTNNVSLYGPTVQNAPFTGLGDAISGGLQDFLQARQLKSQKDLEAYQTGFGATYGNAPMPAQSTDHPGGLQGALRSGFSRLLGRSDPTPPPAPTATAPAVSDTDHIRDALSAVGNGTITLPGQTATSAGGVPVSVMGTTQSAPAAPPTGDLGDALRSGQSSVLNQAGGQQSSPAGIDPNSMVRLPSGQMVPLGMTPFGQRQQQIQADRLAKTAAASKDAAEANMANAHATLFSNQSDPEWIGKKTRAEEDAKLADQLFLEVQKNGMSYDSAAKLAALHGGIASQLLDQRLSGENANQMPYESTAVTDPTTGQVHVGTLNKRTGQVTDTGVEAKQPTTKAAKPSDVATFAASSLDAMQAAHDNLNKFGGTVATRSQLGNFIAGHNPLDNTLQQANQAGDAWVTFATPIMYKGRTTKVESDMIRQSQVPLATDNPAVIQQKMVARQAVMQKARQMAGQAVPQSQPDSGAATPAQTPQQLWDAAVKLHGQAKVLQEYGPRPQ